MTTIPAGKTWFDTHTKSFADVPVGPDGSVDTTAFLEASESTTTLFDVLGSSAFSIMKNDMTGNVKKVRERQLASPGTSSTLQELVRSELASKSHKATEGLLWLVRGLDFTAQAIRADVDNNKNVAITEAKPKSELADSFRASYKNTLGPHHSFMMKPIINAAFSATPYRKDFYGKLFTDGSSAADGQAQLEKWLVALEKQVSILKAFMASKEAKW